MLTLVIPTMNRSDFLARLLYYYAENNYKYYITVGDSSEGIHRERGEKIVKKYQKKLKIDYRHVTGYSSLVPYINDLSQRITTPYATFIADDDFLITDGIESCLNFLEKRKLCVKELSI